MKDQLSNAVTNVHWKRVVAVVVYEDCNVTVIVWVNGSTFHIQEVVCCQTASRVDLSISTRGWL
jgi:hypothetical protein